MKGLIIAGVSAVALVLGGLSAYNYANTTQVTGNHMEQKLSAFYQADQLELDTLVKNIQTSLGVSGIGFEKLHDVLVDTIKGRYEGNGSSAAGVGRGQLFSAIKEAYPSVDISVYNRIMDQATAGREAFKQKQLYFRDRIRDYETWETDGLVHSHFVTWMGFPSKNLEARIGETVFHGQDALDHMKVLVTSGSTDTAFKTGHEQSVNDELGIQPKKE
jgi:hypothetical protein